MAGSQQPAGPDCVCEKNRNGRKPATDGSGLWICI